jgi:hypothetical protein
VRYINRRLQEEENAVKEAKDEIQNLRQQASIVYDYWSLDYPPDWYERSKKMIALRLNRCSVCRRYFSSGLEVHHKKAVLLGGSHLVENLQVLCSKCHSAKHHGRSRFTSQSGGGKIDILKEAINSNRSVTFDYKKRDESSWSRRTITPHQFVRADHKDGDDSTLCVSGYCHLRRASRTFALDQRMRNVKIV